MASEMACKQLGLGMHFEDVILSMLQQNGRAERKFATLFGWVHAVLNGGGFDKFWCH